MARGLEPAFTPGRPVWPLAGMSLAVFEPDDPDLAIPHGALQNGIREAPERLLWARHDGLITHRPAEPLAPRPARTLDLQRKWKFALIASLIFHASLALFFIQATDDAVQIEGAEYSGAAQAGNADVDATSAGSVAQFDNPVEVTMISMLDAKPVETIEAEAVPVETTTQATEAIEPVTAEVETLAPVDEPKTEPVEVARAEPTMATPSETVESETAEPVAPAPATAAQPDRTAAEPVERQQAEVADTETTATTSETVPEVLATDQPLPADEENVVQKPLETQAAQSAETSETVAAEPVEAARPTVTEAGEAVKAASADARPVEAEPAARAEQTEARQAEKAEPVQTATVKAESVEDKPVKAELAQDEPVKAEADLTPAPRKAEPKEDAPQKKKATTSEQPKPKKADQGKKTAEKSTNKPKSLAGNAGKSQADATRGQKSSGGQSASSGGGSKSSAAGNAAVSNYPGKVAAKVRRALRYPAEAKRQKLRGIATVRFVVSASGGVSAIRLLSSSGSPVLDKAALDAVRRAAPYPPIPANAGVSSWPFVVPLEQIRR